MKQKDLEAQNDLDHGIYTQNEIAIAKEKNPGYTPVQILRYLEENDLPWSKTNANQIQGYYDPKNDKVVVVI
jgi:hypothetical protein